MKGRTCLSCSAQCCYGVVGFQYTLKAAKKVREEIAGGETRVSTNTRVFSCKELKGFGMVETLLSKREPCIKLIGGRCSVEHHKPRICRTYWCHGRLWEPKEVLK